MDILRTDAKSDRLSGVMVTDVMSRNLVTVDTLTPIRTAAQCMGRHRISCLPVVDGKMIAGLITEADFVSRVVGEQHSVDAPVKQVMTRDPVCVSPEHSMLDVLSLMTRHGFSHMPVCESDGKQLLGIITQTDVIRHQIATSIYMVSDIARMSSISGIREIVAEVPRLLKSLIANGNTAYETGRVISSITGATTRRLLELAEQALGKAPVPYVWLACGSQGRQEQTGSTDQDNCLVLDNTFDLNSHAEYFEKLADFVCDGLNECGYVYCPGNMMASNPRWRQPLATWQHYFAEWIKRPGNEAQMLASVMFDLRVIAGSQSLYEPLQKEAASLAKSNSIFVAHMSTNCLAHPPPLGWFGRIKTHTDTERAGKLDLKHDVAVPIIDLARLHALSGGISAVNTVERLKAESDKSVISRSGRARLLDAYEFASSLRLTHQALQISNARKPDNLIDPSALDSVERDRLRRSLQVIKDIQGAISNRVAVVGR